MAKKSKNKSLTNITPLKPVVVNTATVTIPPRIKANFWVRLTPYFPGIILFIIALIIGLFVFRDYGVSWDEPAQRDPGLLSYNYIFFDNQALFTTPTDNHGAGFELLLVFFEKWMNLTDSRDVYLMRHIAAHIFFLISVFAGYILIFRLYRNKFIASLGFIMLAFAPRIYAHSFFNTKDMPFLAMFIITLACCQIAFKNNKPWLFLILGTLCGYTTSIRIMGIMLGAFIFLFLLIDFVDNLINKKAMNKIIINMLLFSVGFVFLLYIAWPYLWKDPYNHFIESFNRLAHFDWNGLVLLNGKIYQATNLPWFYFPTWFLITNPEIWLVAGFAGVIWLAINFFKRPLTYIRNTPERNLLLYLMCFFAPIMAVILLHSVIYDDWRHLYFVYPPFVLIGLYFINKMIQTRYKYIVQGVCVLQVLFIGYFMVVNHPFSQVYFNNLLSHDKEYLRKNYEMEYWGCSFKQALDHLIETDTSKKIKVSSDFPDLIANNTLLLPKKDRNRIQLVEMKDADYNIANYRSRPYDYPSYKTVYSISVLNSTILSIFRQTKDTAKQRQFRIEEISILNKYLADHPDNYEARVKITIAYLDNSQYDSSEINCKRALVQQPNDTISLHNLAIIYFFEKKYSLAIEIFKIEIKLNLHLVKVASDYHDIGIGYLKLKQNDSAAYYFNKAIEINHAFNDAYFQLGIIYFYDKKYDLAAECFKKLLVLKPGDIDALNNLITSYKFAGNIDSTKKYELKVLKK